MACSQPCRENVHDLRLSNDDLKNLVADSNAEILDDLQSGRLLTTEDFHSHSNVQVIHLTAIHDGVERNQQSLESMTSLIRSLSPLPPREEVDPQTIVLIHEAAATGNLQKLRQFLPADSTTTLLDAEDDAGRTPLHSAAKGGQLATVDFLGQRGSNVNADDRNGCRPLHLALMNGHVDIAKLLVQDFGASESKTDYAGKTPAQYFDHPPLVLWMLKFETREGDRDEKGNTALIHAAIQGHVSSVQYLLDRKVDVSAKNSNLSTALSEACVRGHRDVMALLLTHGANPSQRDQWGYTPFGRCIVRGNRAILQVMLDKGRIDLEEQHTPYMHTALAEATRLRLYSLVGLLVKHGANVNVVDWLDNPVLSRAIVCCEATEVTEMLLGAGANPNTPNKDGWTPVHEAMHYRRWNLFPLLIKHGGDMNVKEKQGLQLPLLSLLVIQRQADLIGQLLLLKNDARVDFEATNRDGWKPLREACHHDHHGRAEIAKMLLEAGASVWGRVNLGFMGTHTQWTCLMQAARQDSSEVIRLLVEYKADLEASDSAGWTALRIAVENRRDSAACTLLMLNADPQSRGRDDKTPFSRASRHELPGVFMLCKALGKG